MMQLKSLTIPDSPDQGKVEIRYVDRADPDGSVLVSTFVGRVTWSLRMDAFGALRAEVAVTPHSLDAAPAHAFPNAYKG